MPTTHADPAVQRRRLQIELRKHRQEAGKTQREVAEAMDWSPSKVIRIEKGQVGISRNDLRALLEYYGLTDARTFETLLDMAKDAGRQGTWADYRGVVDPGFLNYLEFESSAWIIRNYESDFVPGLVVIDSIGS
jgi:transcriptional regulator with XRE-family HTH domain